jgi:hypothetical protein
MSPLVLLLAPLALAAPDKAPDQGKKKKGPKDCEVVRSEGKNGCLFDTWGELRLIQSMPTDFQVDSDGTMMGQGPFFDTRLRMGTQLGPRKIHGRLEGDLFEGQAAGDPWDIAGDLDMRERQIIGVMRTHAFDLRKASVGGLAGPVSYEVGLQTSHWGLGMVANDGNHDPVFGRTDFGDRVLRARVAARPIDNGRNPLTFILAGDRVIEDEFAEANLFEEAAGDVAWQGIATIAWLPDDPKDPTRGGIYGVYRNQTDADGERTLKVGIVDAYGDHTIDAGDWKIRIAAEGATIFGSTDLIQTYNSRDGVKVRSGGVTGLVSASPEETPIRGMVRGGWASGDSNPDDDTTHDFTYDRDFDAGMTVFDEFRGAIDAQAYNQLNNPEYSGGAPEGADALVNEGAFSHAIFVQPVIGGAPLDWLDIQGGVTMSWNTRPIAHPFTTYRNGGIPANHLNVETTGYKLGTELNWAVKVGDVSVLDKKSRWKLKPALLLQGGHAMMSEDMGGETISLVTATGRVRW